MKNTIAYTIILLSILMSSTLDSKGQNASDKNQKKNTIHVNGATLKFIGMYSVNYERVLLNTQLLNININAGVGGWYVNKISETASGYSLPASFNNLVGKGNHFLEVDVGVRYTFLNEQSDTNISPFYPIINIGYRYQKQNGRGLIFRAFIGYSGIGVGIGKAF